MWRQPARGAPVSGLVVPYSSRSAMRPGISDAAIVISLRPHAASEMSATLKLSAMIRSFSSPHGAAFFVLRNLRIVAAFDNARLLLTRLARDHVLLVLFAVRSVFARDHYL